jgi:hypothetical protein
MAYTAWVNRATGYVALATDWNIIGANFAAGVPDIFTAKGDIAVATAADAASPLAVGANGTLLTAASGEATGLGWTTPSVARSYARYKISAEFALPNNAATLVNYDTVVYDDDTAVTTGAAWKFTVPASHDGYFLVCASILIKSNANWTAAEKMELQLFKNNSIYCVLASTYAQATGTYALFTTGSAVISLVATDYIDVRCYHNTGSAEVTNSDGNYSHIAIARLF